MYFFILVSLSKRTAHCLAFHLPLPPAQSLSPTHLSACCCLVGCHPALTWVEYLHYSSLVGTIALIQGWKGGYKGVVSPVSRMGNWIFKQKWTGMTLAVIIPLTSACGRFACVCILFHGFIIVLQNMFWGCWYLLWAVVYFKTCRSSHRLSCLVWAGTVYVEFPPGLKSELLVWSCTVFKLTCFLWSRAVKELNRALMRSS